MKPGALLVPVASTFVRTYPIFIYSTSTAQGYDIYKHMHRTRMKKLIEGCKTCLPLHVRAIHLFCGRSTTLLSSVDLPVFKFLMGRQARYRTIVHGSTPFRYMTAELKQYGFKTENLSRIIGGSFDNSNLMPLLMEFESLSSDEDAPGNLTMGEVVV